MLNWYEGFDPKNPLVVSSRIRLARNIKGIPFPKRMSDEQKLDVLNKFKSILDGVKLSGGYTLKYINMEAVPEEELFAMVERHVISPDFAKKQGPKGLVISENESVSVMLLEEDHIRIQVILGGLNLSSAYEIAKEIERLLSESLPLAFDNTLGYLTECPTNLGTGLRASLMLHLPILKQSGMLGSISDSVSKIGLTVRGMYGEGSSSKANLFQLSNQVTLGISEEAAIENLTAIATGIVQKELSARDGLERRVIENSVYRSLGTLRYARLLNSEEMMNLISNVKLGIEMGILEDINPALPISLLVQTGAYSLQKSNGRMTPADRDVLRAEIIREKL
ncbi:MAG: protein arginine kinase [Clostridia bacterium]|nr:protein arginine kinase [Clostridia bacterium]MBQ7108700.1 protein arginine kinase [Clostridia bacterium]MBQ9920467.1 protein arginine kinase [Clostridia bacterium]